jgi:hypothetical protein
MTSELVDLSCDYGAATYNVRVDLSKSPYYGKLPSVMDPKYLPFYSTIDDPVMKDIADQLNGQLEGRRDFIKVSVLLAFVQQNIWYVSDEERFGKDIWETPIYVLRERKADCDGMASLYTSIAYNMGLDVVTVIVTGHMCSAVKAAGCHGKGYRYNDKTYIHVETTDRLPAVGRYWEDSKELYIEAPQTPTEEFKNLMEDYL